MSEHKAVREIDESPMLREVDEIDWREYITQFEDELFPIFAARGVTFGDAFIIWNLQRIMNRVERIAETLEDE